MPASERQEPRLRFVVIGIGAGILGSHREGLAQPFVELVAGSDVDVTRGQKNADELHCAFYSDYQQMLAETKPDVAVILTPHFLHAQIAIACLKAGSHVLVEKPMALQVAEADAMIATAKQEQRLLCVVLQQRFRPEVQAAHEFIEGGHLGELQQVTQLAVWPRRVSYYTMASWRGTWAGEGGGVLMNQASHNLDELCYLCGLPSRVFAWTRAALHHIETEDTAHALIAWPQGYLGTLHISSAEAGISDYLRIVGTKGILEVTPKKLQIQTLQEDMKDYLIAPGSPYDAPVMREEPVHLAPPLGNNHLAVYKNLYAAITHGNTYTDGLQGRMELELANAIIYSSQTRTEVELPLDRQRYAELLKQLISQHSK